jgi:hypothetical protein
MYAGREYPQGLSYIRQRAKEAFMHNATLDELGLLKAVAKGRYMVREMIAISKLHKYRQMNKRYGEKPS